MEFHFATTGSFVFPTGHVLLDIAETVKEYLILVPYTLRQNQMMRGAAIIRGRRNRYLSLATVADLVMFILINIVADPVQFPIQLTILAARQVATIGSNFPSLLPFDSRFLGFELADFRWRQAAIANSVGDL